MADADPTPAWTGWSSLDPEQQREVGRCAKQGRRHPDPAVAAIAHAWAEVLVESYDVEKADRSSTWASRGLNLLGAIVWTFSTSDLEDSWQRRIERRWARRILAAK